MANVTISPTLKTLAKDLTKDFPRSPRETIGGYVLAARMLDKCRATLNGTAGEYHFNCPLDKQVLDFTGINPDEFQAYVATGASDDEVGTWIEQHSQVKNRIDVIQWNNKLRDLRLSDLPPNVQEYMEDYIPQFVPKGKVVYHWFDVYDYEEGRL